MRGVVDLDAADHVDQTVRHDQVAAVVDRHVAHDVAAAGNSPSLKFRGLRIEPHDRVGLSTGFDVPECTPGRGNTVRPRLRAAWRSKFLDLAAFRIEVAEVA